MIKEEKQDDGASGLASAPGDLPMSVVLERNACKATQFRHDNTFTPAAPKPDQPVTVTAISGAAVGIVRAELWYTTGGAQPDARSARLTMAQADVEWTPQSGYLYHWQVELPPLPDGTVVRYKIAGYASSTGEAPDRFAHDGSGFWFQYGEAGLTTFAYQVRAAPGNLPDWMDDAIIYHIFLDRFRNNSADGLFPPDLDPQAKHGGTLQGVINALPYLADLGINCLWLSPVGPSSTYHRYDQSDYFAVDPDLGSVETLRELAAAVRARGMRLILDFVPSHGSWEMPEFKAAQQDRNAPSFSWFVFDEWPHSYRCFLGMVPSLVSLDGNDESLRRFLIDSARFWLCDIGFDGLRLDHAMGHGSDFWVAFSHALLQAKPDVALCGEVTDTPDMLRRYRGRLQGVLDFPLAQIVRVGFGRGDWDGAELSGALQAYIRYMQNGPGRVTFFDNHDMNRFLFVANGDRRRLKQAALCLLTLPFPPSLYYGTEIGLSQNQDKDAAGYGGDHEARRDMPWDPANWDGELLTFFKAIIQLRRNHAALRKGQWSLLETDSGGPIFAYQLALGSEMIQVYFNLSEDRQQIHLSGAQRQQILLTTDSTTEHHAVAGTKRITLAGLSGIVLAAKADGY